MSVDELPADVRERWEALSPTQRSEVESRARHMRAHDAFLAGQSVALQLLRTRWYQIRKRRALRARLREYAQIVENP